MGERGPRKGISHEMRHDASRCADATRCRRFTPPSAPAYLVDNLIQLALLLLHQRVAPVLIHLAADILGREDILPLPDGRGALAVLAVGLAQIAHHLLHVCLARRAADVLPDGRRVVIVGEERHGVLVIEHRAAAALALGGGRGGRGGRGGGGGEGGEDEGDEQKRDGSESHSRWNGEG